MVASYEAPEFEQWQGALARAGHGARRRRRHYATGSSFATRRTCSPACGCTTSTASACASCRCPSSATSARARTTRTRTSCTRRFRPSPRRAGSTRSTARRSSWSLLWEDKPPLDTSQIESKLVFYAVEGRHAGADVSHLSQGDEAGRQRIRCSCTATAASTSASARITCGAGRPSSTAAACSSKRVSAAATSTASAGTTRPSSATSRTASTTSSPRPSGSCARSTRRASA